MRLQFFFRHMLPSSAVRDYAEAKFSECIGKYNLRLDDVLVSFAVEHADAKASCHFLLDGQALHLSENAPQMYAAIDGLVDRLDECLRRIKDKMCSHRGPKAYRAEQFVDEDRGEIAMAAVY